MSFLGSVVRGPVRNPEFPAESWRLRGRRRPARIVTLSKLCAGALQLCRGILALVEPQAAAHADGFARGAVRQHRIRVQTRDGGIAPRAATALPGGPGPAAAARPAT